MPASYRAFLVELYEEFLEEASFLYEQRLTLFDNPEITWKSIGEFEDRFEPHIDGLVVGGDRALDVCIRRAQEGDSGELHAAMRVFCRQDRFDLAGQALENLDPEKPSRGTAVADALKYELPTGWEQKLGRVLTGRPDHLRILATVAGYRRTPALSTVLASVWDGSPEAKIIQAFGRLREIKTRDRLRASLYDPGVALDAAIALLRMGERPRQTEEWPSEALALAGETLLDPNASLLALGLMGHAESIPLLLRSLEQPYAALALEMITGVQIRETVAVPDPDEEDDDPRTWTKITRRSQDPHQWINALAHFPSAGRFRAGRPMSLLARMECLEADTTSHPLRIWTAEELAIQHQITVPFETDMPVIRQMEAMDAMRQVSINYQKGGQDRRGS